jgi:hypothetical protein
MTSARGGVGSRASATPQQIGHFASFPSIFQAQRAENLV